MFFTVLVTSSCQRQPTPVFCRGISQNNGKQFENSTSEGFTLYAIYATIRFLSRLIVNLCNGVHCFCHTGARGLFILDQGQAILKPQGTSIYGTELQVKISFCSLCAGVLWVINQCHNALWVSERDLCRRCCQ